MGGGSRQWGVGGVGYGEEERMLKSVIDLLGNFGASQYTTNIPIGSTEVEEEDAVPLELHDDRKRRRDGGVRMDSEEMEGMRDDSFLHVGRDWRRLWMIEGPPKLKHFLWRAAREVLSTRIAIAGRGMNVWVS
ncbi:hypothetical protein LINPERHAP1_LOCUS16923 [Linum perenne]